MIKITKNPRLEGIPFFTCSAVDFNEFQFTETVWRYTDGKWCYDNKGMFFTAHDATWASVVDIGSLGQIYLNSVVLDSFEKQSEALEVIKDLFHPNQPIGNNYYEFVKKNFPNRYNSIWRDLYKNKYMELPFDYFPLCKFSETKFHNSIWRYTDGDWYNKRGRKFDVYVVHDATWAAVITEDSTRGLYLDYTIMNTDDKIREAYDKIKCIFNPDNHIGKEFFMFYKSKFPDKYKESLSSFRMNCPSLIDEELEDIENANEYEIVDPKSLADTFPLDDPVHMYLKEIGKIKPLTAAEEAELILRIAEDNDIEAKRQLTEANLRLACSIAKHYIDRGKPFIDIIQESNLGLIKAVDRFDYTKGYKFSTFVTWWVRESIEAFIKRLYL